jgi:amphi-Trp domain-containing protein
MDRYLLKDKTNKSAQELSSFLRAVADKIDQGNMTISKGSDSINLEFPKQFGFRFSVKDDIGTSGTQRKVQIGFRWLKGKEGEVVEPADLIIS